MAGGSGTSASAAEEAVAVAAAARSVRSGVRQSVTLRSALHTTDTRLGTTPSGT